MIYNFLPLPRAGTLSTVIYSDRYFLYGLPLRTCPSLSSDSPTHYTPLPCVGVPQAPGGGVLAGLAWPRADPARYGSIRRGRKDLPRVFGAPLEPTALYPSRRLPLDYRQSAECSSLVPAGPLVSERRMRCETPSLRPISEIESAPRPEFARPDEAASPSRPTSAVSASERTLPASVQYGTTGPLATYEALGSMGSLEPSGGVLHRKVLNTERLLPPLSSSGVRRDPRARAQRRITNALLIFSGAFYAVCFLAFYFLSLP